MKLFLTDISISIFISNAECFPGSKNREGHAKEIVCINELSYAEIPITVNVETPEDIFDLSFTWSIRHADWHGLWTPSVYVLQGSLLKHVDVLLFGVL